MAWKVNKKKLFKLVFFIALIAVIIYFGIKFFTSEDDPAPIEPKSMFSSGMLAVRTNGEWGYVSSENAAGYMIVPQFKKVTDFHGNRAAARVGSKYCIIDTEGILVTNPEFDSVGEFSSNGYIAVEVDGKWGYIDSDGNYVINPKFNTAYGFTSSKNAAVSINGSYGYIGEDGEYTIAPQYDMAYSFSDDGLAVVKIDGKYGYITPDGSAAIEPGFDEAYTFKNGIAVVKQNGDYGAIDTEGNFVIDPQFDERFSFNDRGFAKVRIGHKYGYIDQTGIYRINPRFTDMGGFTAEGLIFAQRSDGKYGFTDETGNFKIPAKYSGAGDFACGLAPVKDGEVWGYIDPEGNTVIEPQYAEASVFYAEGYAVVRKVDSSIVIIDTTGKTVFSGGESELDEIMIR